MSSANCPETPRQKMISMMYIVLTAMLALNVSTDVLNGFTLVQKNLEQTIHSSEVKNESLYNQFEDLKAQNPKKVGEWLNKALAVKNQTDALFNEIQDLKVKIVKTADGPEGDVNNIIGKDNLDVSAQIAMPTGALPTTWPAHILRTNVEAFRDSMVAIVIKDSAKVASIEENFYTGTVLNANNEKKSWEASIFESMPVSAAITLLTKIQSDLRYTESEVVSYLKNQVDASDFRVNKISAEVIPVSSYVTRGGKYEARIILAAIDSTQRPIITVNGSKLEGGNSMYTATCNKVGTYDIKGSIALPRGDGSIQNYDFESSYIVGEPTAIVSADMMNVLYAGYANPVSVSVPGVPASSIVVSINNARTKKTAKGWIVTPIKVGTDCNVVVSAKMPDGKTKRIGTKPFRVKQLPDPIAFLAYGNRKKHKSGNIRRADLVSAKGIGAELNDADIDVKYNVLSFELNYFDSMGNSIVKRSNGKNLTGEQKDIMRKMTRGKKFYISNIRAKGPDNVERRLPSVDVNVQ